MGDEERGPLSVDVAAAVQDSAVSGIVGPEGGALELPGVARVTFPAGAFAAPERVVLAITDYPQSVEGVGMFRVSGGLRPSFPYDVRIRFGGDPVVRFEVTLAVPDEYLEPMPRDRGRLQVGALVGGGGGMEDLENYILLKTEYDTAAAVLRVIVPLSLVRAPDTPDEPYEVILLIGIYL